MLQNSFMNKSKPVSRKSFLAWGVGISSLLAVPAFLLPSKKRKKANNETAKMLTQDGRLVSIDITHIPQNKKRIQPSEIHTWITKKK